MFIFLYNFLYVYKYAEAEVEVFSKDTSFVMWQTPCRMSGVEMESTTVPCKYVIILQLNSLIIINWVKFTAPNLPIAGF